MAIQTRIKQRFDFLSNWTENNIVLLDGELAIVDCGLQTIRFKVGDGKSKFSQLPYVDKHIIAESITQGIHSSAVPYGLAAGAYLSANANFSQAFGYDVQVSSSHPYAFVWNGDDTRAIGDYYESHGKGTFNINALSGLSGIFIGEQSLAELLDSKGGNKITIDDRISGISGYSDLSVVKLSANEYASLLTSNSLLSNTLYIVQDNYMDAYGQQIKNVAPATDLSDAVNLEQLNNSVSSIPIDDYLPLLGGNLSGDLSVTNADVKILSGNYVQTTDPSKVNIFSSMNSFLQAEFNKAEYGNPSIGSKGFIVLSVISPNKLQLSGIVDIPNSAQSSNWSIAISSSLDAQFSDISSVDIVDGNTVVTFNNNYSARIQEASALNSSQLTALVANGKNALYCPAHTEVGNYVFEAFNGNHAEGGSTHAIAQYTHAEGRGSTAEGRYAHAEGNVTIAGGAGAHSEGMFTKAFGNRSHAEGEHTLADGTASHAEGISAIANGEYSHAEGYQTSATELAAHAEGAGTIASGNSSHAEGYYSQALSAGAHAEGGYKNGDDFAVGGIASHYAAHAEGARTQASGKYSHAEGYLSKATTQTAHAEGENTEATSQASHAEGYQTHAISATAAHAEGAYTYASGNSSHAEGKSTYSTSQSTHSEGFETSAIASYAHAEGYHTTASNTAAHAEGSYTQAIGKGSHAEGSYTQAIGKGSHAEGGGGESSLPGGKSEGLGSHAEGYSTYAKGNWSHAEGEETQALKRCTHAAGKLAKANQDRQWVWNGVASTYDPTTTVSAGAGSFCINPANGINGFYIGNQSLSSILTSNCQPKGNYLLSDDVKLSYSNQTIWLSSKDYVTSVDCSDFIKDGMLSTVKLCSNQLIFNFNTESEQDPISVDLSSFVDNYDATIQAISAEVSALPTKADIEEGWLSEWTISPSADNFRMIWFESHWEPMIGNRYVHPLSGDSECDFNASFFYGPIEGAGEIYTVSRRHIAGPIPTKTSELSNDSGFLTEHQSLSNYYTKSETSSASEISNTLSTKQDISALLADVSSIVLSSVDEWVITNETEWSLVSEPIFFPGDGWWEAEFSDGNTTINVIDFNNQDATQLHFENEDPDLDVYLEKKNINVLSVATYDYLATSYEQKSSLQSDVSSIVLSSAPYGDILFVSEFGTLVNRDTSPEVDYSFSGEIGTHHFSINHFNGGNSYWAWELDADYGNEIEDFDIDTAQTVTIDITDTPLATELGVSSITFTKTQKTRNVLGLVTFDSLSTELSTILSKYKTYDATVSSLSDDGYALFSQVSSKAEVSALNAKITIDDRIFGVCEQTDLSIVHLSSTDYAQLCADGQLLSNALYIVEDSFTNNYGKQIKNVAEPTLSDDAATKAYVDNIVNQQTSALIQRIQALENQLSGLEEQLHTINNG